MPGQLPCEGSEHIRARTGLGLRKNGEAHVENKTCVEKKKTRRIGYRNYGAFVSTADRGRKLERKQDMERK